MSSEVRSKLRVLDFDIENRPLSYWYDGKCTAEVTAIAWSWVGQERVYCTLLGEVELGDMLAMFANVYAQADIVTGHYIRRHDLPILNGAMLEAKMPPLGRKMTSDTKMDLVRRGELAASQEALSAMYGLPEAKQHMTQTAWREANRLTPQGIEQTRRRVVDDVIQHKALRARLIEAGALKPGKVWSP